MRRWVVTFGGAGLLPGMPGTWGSAAACAVLLVIHLAIQPDAWAWAAILAGGVAVCSVLTLWLWPWARAHFGKADPGPFVLDEAAGICLTLLAQPAGGWHMAWTIAAALVAFRVFDVLKPPPVRQLEKLPRGWGVLADDLMAGVYANVVCQLVGRVV